MKYALVTMLAPIPSDKSGIPPEWFTGAPSNSYFVADIFDDPQNLTYALKGAGVALERKVKESGLP